jgi:hypothetical protein
MELYIQDRARCCFIYAPIDFTRLRLEYFGRANGLFCVSHSVLMGNGPYRAAVYHLGDDNCLVDLPEFSNSCSPSRAT